MSEARESLNASPGSNEPVPDYGIKSDYPELWLRAQTYDFCERLGGSISALDAEIDRALRELWDARRFASEKGETWMEKP